MAKKRPNPNDQQKPRVHKDLDGFDIHINSFGEITTSYDIDKINQFLNRTVDDKKLRHRTDLNLKGDPLPDAEKNDETDDDMLLNETDETLPDDIEPAE